MRCQNLQFFIRYFPGRIPYLGLPFSRHGTPHSLEKNVGFGSDYFQAGLLLLSQQMHQESAVVAFSLWKLRIEPVDMNGFLMLINGPLHFGMYFCAIENQFFKVKFAYGRMSARIFGYLPFKFCAARF